MSQPKIAFVRRGFSRSGGAEAYLQRLARGLVERDIYPRLITTPDWPADEWPFGKLTHIDARSPRAFADEVEKLIASRRKWRVFSLERVWRCNFYRAGDGIHAAWLKRKPQTRFNAWLRRRKDEEILALERSMLQLQHAEIVVVNSEMVRREIVETYGFPDDRLRLIRNGIPTSEYRFSDAERAAARDVLQLQHADVAVLFVGTGWERKGLRFAVDAVEKLANPRVKLLVAGRGKRSGFDARYAVFLGESADVKRVYAAADVFILPTLYDPFSNACLEALAAGLPVITTRDNGFSEIVEDGVHGSVVPHASAVSDLTEALGHWMDASRRSAARPKNLELAARYDIARNVEETLALIDQPASAASTVGNSRNT